MARGSNVLIFAVYNLLFFSKVHKLFSFKGGTAIKTQKRPNTKIFQTWVFRYFFLSFIKFKLILS